ncbi:MAG: dihydropteroate synthase [Odoribacteraceae bacterium]|jgi:dihydropteroate synthase|nr:dihydropteroate synthase [Odoribacteraceae bacterium]
MENFIQVGETRVGLETPVVMGILNVTADSFHDGGKYVSESQVVARVNEIAEQGAAIIDVGACSTRPGALPVSEKEEIARLSFAVELVRRYHPHLPVSIDTYRANVAREIIDCLGEVMVNDISGGTMDDRMFPTVAELNAPYVLTHVQGTPLDMQRAPHYDDVAREVHRFLEERVGRLRGMGCTRLIVDPGFGFGKSVAHNYRLMDCLERFLDLGCPLLAGVSRKSMICKLLGITPAEALNGTTVLNTIALAKGAAILRVHDVKEAVEAVKIYHATRTLEDENEDARQ